MRKRSTVCGSAYVFALGPDCNDNGDADFCDIRDGASRDDNDNGIPDDCEVVQVVIDISFVGWAVPTFISRGRMYRWAWPTLLRADVEPGESAS